MSKEEFVCDRADSDMIVRIMDVVVISCNPASMWFGG